MTTGFLTGGAISWLGVIGPSTCFATDVKHTPHVRLMVAYTCPGVMCHGQVRMGKEQLQQKSHVCKGRKKQAPQCPPQHQPPHRPVQPGRCSTPVWPAASGCMRRRPCSVPAPAFVLGCSAVITINQVLTDLASAIAVRKPSTNTRARAHARTQAPCAGTAGRAAAISLRQIINRHLGGQHSNVADAYATLELLTSCFRGGPPAHHHHQQQQLNLYSSLPGKPACPTRPKGVPLAARLLFPHPAPLPHPPFLPPSCRARQRGFARPAQRTGQPRLAVVLAACSRPAAYPSSTRLISIT